MMGNVAQFPVVNRPVARPFHVPVSDSIPATLPSTGGRRGEYALADIARPLGLSDRPVRAIIQTLRLLARHDRMPLPRTPRFVSGVLISGPNMIVKASKWDAGEFDAWLDGRGPETPSPAIPVPIREEMRQRAVRIGGAR